jgi:bifunctional UDP-N-acetylglucosamine pyrophosphorylase/glucosamine-1-phosphate N-acetyltransferase
MSLNIIILAAGKGKRMCTELPKVLHKLAGLTLLEHVVQTAQLLNPDTIYVVYGNGGERLLNDMAHLNVAWIEQPAALGTGHAVSQVLPYLKDNGQVLILYGDVPLVSPNTLQQLLQTTAAHNLGLIVTELNNPTGFGRILRDEIGKITAIVEQKDATPEEQEIREINTGIMTASAESLQKWLPCLKSDNAQHEYYLTDIVAMAVADGREVNSITTCPDEVRGVNTLSELMQLERIYQQQKAAEFMQAGVTILDPARFDVRGKVSIEHDVIIDINVILEGTVSIGAHTTVGPNTILRNVQIGENVNIQSNCVIEDAILDNGCTVGPFARIRPGTHINADARIGNFVEIKNTTLGAGSKVPHLSYVGDAQIGKNVNMGAGTITVNYDGVNKHKTIIGDNAFVGCDSQLIAPITIGEGAYIGAGSTITSNAPPHELTLARTKQRTIEGWKKKIRKN